MKDQGTPTTATETKPDATPTEPAKPTPPETYTFKAPDGKSYDQSLIDGATPIFRELGLDQAAADKLVAFYDKHAQGAADLAVKAVNEMRANWRDQVSKDPIMGGKLDQMKADIGRMKSSIFENDSAGLKAFNEAMDLTGAGDHPAIVRAWWRVAQTLNEGTHVSGNAPSPAGQKSPGAATRPSLAEAMYPNLVNNRQ